jgi:phospholipid/cholesterol/gamma-HCH transport system ATP-binding protein
VIQIRGLEKSFGSNKVLKRVDLDISTGETMTIIGGSGTGKSVLLKHIVGLMKPDAGTVTVDGVEISRLDEDELFDVRKRFGYLFQGAALFDSLTVGENVAFGIHNVRPDLAKDWRNIAVQKLALVGLGPQVADMKPAELSGGMKKRVALARAVAHEPDYILYDEPTTGLDPIMADVINDLILELRHALGATAVAVTHDMKSAYKISSRIAMLYGGRIVALGTPEEIQNSSDPMVRQFITGSSQGPIQMQVRQYA